MECTQDSQSLFWEGRVPGLPAASLITQQGRSVSEADEEEKHPGDKKAEF